MSTKTKERNSKETYRQCVMRLAAGSTEKPPMDNERILVIGGEGKTDYEYVAWIPTKMAVIGKHILIDSVPGRWLIVQAGDPRPAFIVEAYAENARKGFESVTGHEQFKKGQG